MTTIKLFCFQFFQPWFVPHRPDEFLCQKAVALIVSKSGEMEVFGEDSKCNRLMGNIPPLSLEGHTVNLLDNYLVIAASGISDNANGWWYHSLENARGGLLANPWKHTKTLGTDFPRHHVSFVYGKDLVLLGGEKDVQLALQNAREENGEWNQLGLTNQEDGSSFDEFKKEACVVKVTRDIFYVMGGKSSKKVYSINMKEQKVQEVGSLRYTRANHACAIIPGSSSNDFRNQRILVTGGTKSRDEIFDVTTRKSKLLSKGKSMKVRRMNHQMVTLGQKIFALGGQRQADDFSALDVIEVFDEDSDTWSIHSANLLSKSTEGLALTELPSSAVSCVQECQCGVKSGARIVGGAEAQVTGTTCWVFPPENFCSRLPPIPGWASCSLPAKPTFLRLNVQQHW